MSTTSALNEEHGERVLGVAQREGIKWGIVATIVVGAGTYVATKRWEAFNKYMSLSAKVSLPTMAGLGLFSYRFEMAAHDVQYHPEKYGFPKLTGKMAKKEYSLSSMPIHQRVMNSLYDHPFRMIAAMGIPFAAVVIKQQAAVKHLTFSQKVMHSRVFAQFGVISILLVTMGFKEYMDRRGRFEEPTGLLTECLILELYFFTSIIPFPIQRVISKLSTRKVRMRISRQRATSRLQFP